MVRKRRPRYGAEYGEDEISPRLAAQLDRRLARTDRHALARAVELALSNYRFASGISQQQLAAILGVKQPQVARLESGLVTPTLDTLKLISERLGIDFRLEVKSGRLTASATPRRGSRRA